LSTRGRANLVRSALEGQDTGARHPLQSEWISEALATCLSCKACTVECPSNVNFSLLKAELSQARHRQGGMRDFERLVSHADLFGRLGCLTPRLANFITGSWIFRSLLSKWFGYAWQRPLPRYALRRFDRWFDRHPRPSSAPRGRVVLWDDTFVRYHEPHIGQAACKVLEAAGFAVELAHGRKCCGRPAFSQGDLDHASELGRHNLRVLRRHVDQAPILFLEPSCYSMFAQDYAELGLEDAESIATRCFLFEDFVERLLAHEPDALSFAPREGRIVIHPHCHLKALLHPGFLERLARRLPLRDVTLLDSACCGMAGAFGATASKYELSLKVAEPLARRIREQPFGTVVVASGTSCRQQISHLAPVRPRHMAEVLADALTN
jgi:Fe-S oxidoreductase